MKCIKKIKFFNIIIAILLVITMCILCYSLIHSISWYKDNTEIQNEITNINANGNNNVEEDNSIDFNALEKKNKDTVGWLKVNNTNIDYPTLKYKNNTYYLSHTFNKKENDAGWIFMDYRNNSNMENKNTIIYGHARLDKSMFGTLRNILKKDWYSNNENQIITFITKKYNYYYKVFSAYHIETENYYLRTDFNDDSEFYNFITILKKRSKIKFDVDINEKDKILTLSSCYSDDEKIVVHAVLIKKEMRN